MKLICTMGNLQRDDYIWARLTTTVQFKFEIVKNAVYCRLLYDTNLSSTTYHLNISKTKEGGTIVHTCSVHYKTCHMFRKMIRHGCYSTLLASMNHAPLHHYVSNGGCASLPAFHVNELSSPTDVKHADVQLHLRKVLLSHYVSNGGFASLRAFHVNELSSPTDVKHADVQLHLRKVLLSQNMFLSIAVVSQGPTLPIVHHPNIYRLVENHVRDDYILFDLILYTILALR